MDGARTSIRVHAALADQEVEHVDGDAVGVHPLGHAVPVVQRRIGRQGFLHQKWFLAYGPGSGAEGLARNVELVRVLREEMAKKSPDRAQNLLGLGQGNPLSGAFSNPVGLAYVIEDGQIDTAPWITHHAAFDEMIDVFPKWTLPETGVIKAVVSV